jgi:tetratricopeptide (TPR) repeat protein
MMHKVDQYPWLQAVLLTAACAISIQLAIPQPPATALFSAGQPTPTVTPPQTSPEQLGDLNMLHQHYQAAVDAYKKAPRNSADAWNKMGIAYQMMHKSDEATHCYKMSIKLNPGNAHVLNNLGTLYDSLKQPRTAERMYRRALKVDPESAITYKNLGSNLLSQKKYSKGWDAYKAALTLDPNIFANSSNLQVEAGASLEERGALNYYMARGCVRVGQDTCAIEYLRLALSERYTTPKKLEADSEFSSLRGTPAFEQLLAARGSYGKP